MNPLDALEIMTQAGDDYSDSEDDAGGAAAGAVSTPVGKALSVREELG